MEIRQIISDTGVTEWILLGLFLIAFIIQLSYQLNVYIRFPLYKPEKKRKTRKAISVIICAKNEEQNLKQTLPLILEQDYPEFEVVVVNDSSTDNTEQLLSELSVNHKHLRYTSIPLNEKFTHGKKLAVTIGLKSARHDHVLLTDADCYPASDQWLQKMASNLIKQKKIVLGYGKYEKRKGLLNLLIRYETAVTAIQYFSYAIKGRPYMGVGRNLAYEKALFFSNRGFASHYHIPSGDDDLFINETATGQNTTVEFSSESHTLSIPAVTWSGWIKQKKRHLSAGNHYNPGSKIRLAMDWISRLVFYITLLWLVIISPWKWIVIALFGVVLLTRMVVLKTGFHRLEEKYLLLPSLLFDPLLPLTLGIVWISTLFETKYQPWS